MTTSLPDHWLDPPGIPAATIVQREMALACETEDRIGEVRTIGGVDTSMKWRDSRGPIHAAVVTLAWPAGVPGERASMTMVPAIPYVPGYLGFREVPAIAAAVARLAVRPHLLLVDGQGRSHPRRCGLATHLGVVLDVPTIGCAKSLLCGTVEGELGEAPGSTAPLVDRGEQVGVALRTRARARPIYISIGHRISLDSAVAWVNRLCDGLRLPFPIRMAHEAANAARRAAQMGAAQ